MKIGTRGSQLALYQAELVKAKLKANYPCAEVEIVKIRTTGDMRRRGGMATVLQTKRVFTREIEEALLEGKVDIAVHSAKDLSAVLPEGLEIAAVLPAEDARDCLISKDNKKLSELSASARIGTGSLRRKMQLLRLNPALIVEEVHGNVDSRIRKVEEGVIDALVLAYAGVKRLGLTSHVAEVFEQEQFYPSPGQGIIAIQTRSGDAETKKHLVGMNHRVSERRLVAERAFLKRLDGGCQLPCGMVSMIEGAKIKVLGGLFSLEGEKYVEASLEGEVARAEALGRELAEDILEKGGKAILEKIRNEIEKK